MRPFFGFLVARDPTGASWLADLLAAAPHGQERLNRLDGDPGTLLPAVTSVEPSGLLGCFEYPVPAPRELLVWFVEHSDELTWPAKQTYSADTTKHRRALLYDEPRGRAGRRPGRRFASGASANRAWWCFEGRSMLDCALITDRLVVTVEGKRTESILDDEPIFEDEIPGTRARRRGRLQAAQPAVEVEQLSLLLVAARPPRSRPGSRCAPCRSGWATAISRRR